MPHENKPEASLLRSVYAELKEGVKDRERHDKAWDSFIAYAAGKHWDSDWSAGRSRPSINLCSKIIKSTTPLLVDRRPQMEVLPVASEHTIIADILNAGLQFIMYKRQFLRKLARALVTSQTVGTVFLEPIYDKDDKEIDIRIVMPWDVVVQGAEDIQDCSLVAIRRRLPLDRIRRLYPNGDKVESDHDQVNASSLPKMVFGTGAGQPVTFTTGDRTETYSSGRKRYDEPSKNMAWIWEVYRREESTHLEKQKVVNASGEIEEIDAEVLDYPGGWRLIILSGNVVLSDTKLPYKHLQVPLIKISNYDIPGEFWGESDLQNVIQPNKVLNVVLGQIVDSLRLGNNPPLLVPVGSGLNINNWVNWPGMVAQFNPSGGAPHWMEPVRLSPETFKVLDLCMQYIYEVSGMSEISEGGVPFAGASGELVAQLREAAMTRIRLKVQNMESALSQLGKQLVGLMQQFWTGHKILRVSGLLPEEKLMSLPGIVLDREGHPAFVPINERQGKGTEMIKVNDISQGDYEVRVVTGSTLAKSHRQMLSDTIALMQAGVYTPEDVAEVLDDPRKDKIKARMAQQAQMQMAAAAQGAQPKPRGGPAQIENPSQQPLPEDLSGAVGRM